MSGKRTPKNLYCAAMMYRMATICKEGSPDSNSHFELAEKLMMGWRYEKVCIYGSFEYNATPFALENLHFYGDMWDKHIICYYDRGDANEKR